MFFHNGNLRFIGIDNHIVSYFEGKYNKGDSYDFLSNFYSAAIEYDGLTFLNAEAAFQAQKCLTEEEKSVYKFHCWLRG